MNFLAPQMLLGLLLVPVAIGFYLWAQRRRSKYAVRFTNLDLLANLTPRRPAWRRHLPPILYLGAIAALLIGLARPTMVIATPREDATVILTMDVSGSMRATDVSPTRLDAAKASALSFIAQLPEGVRVGIVSFASEPVTLVSPTADRGAAQAGDRRPDRPRRDGHGRRAHAGPRHRREDPDRQQEGDPDATASPSAAPPAPRQLPAPAVRRACRPTSRPVSPSSRRSCSPTAPIRSARPNRSTRPSGPRRSASRSTRSPWAHPTARSPSRISSDRTSPSTCRRTPTPSTRSLDHRRDGFDAPTAEHLASVYKNLESRIGYTEQRQEVTFALVGAGLLLVVLGAGLSAVWFGRLPGVGDLADALRGGGPDAGALRSAHAETNSTSRRCALSSPPSRGSTTAAPPSSSMARAGPRSLSGDRRGQRLLPRHQRQCRRGVHDERPDRRMRRRGTRRGRRPARRGVAGRDQVRRRT